LETFIKNVTEVCTKLKFISPEAVIIIATPPVSYYRKTQPNFTVQSIANTLIKFCNNNNYAYWDLFNTSKGLDGASIWKGNNWLNTDLVHFTNKGYDLQAKLLLLAFANSWNTFLEKN
jgi:lysophospholipase L1-like esterase